MNEKLVELIDKAECCSLLCNRASGHWSLVRFFFQIPLILTSSVMCVLNSFENDGNVMRIPNIVVNGISALLLSMQTNLKVNEKCEAFKSLSHNFLLLAHQLESYGDEEVNRDIINSLVDKYDNLVAQMAWEEIPRRYKLEIKMLWEDEKKHLPLNLNGLSGLLTPKRKSGSFKVPNVAQLGNLEV